MPIPPLIRVQPARQAVAVGLLQDGVGDLLVHVPGEMGRNLAVVEIKPIRPLPSHAEETKVKRDIEKLIAFRQRAQYAGAFLLVFGEDADRIRGYGRTARGDGLDTELVELFHHARAGECGTRIGW